jgi:hypothetical protein
MSVSCGLECVLCVGCVRWAWKRLTYIGAYDSETWPPAAADDFHPVPRICQIIMAINEDDLANPKFAPPGLGYADIDAAGIVKRTTYADVGADCPPYIVYVDRRHNEVVLAVRGLNLVRNADYQVRPSPPPPISPPPQDATDPARVPAGPHGQQAREADVRRRLRALSTR